MWQGLTRGRTARGNCGADASQTKAKIREAKQALEDEARERAEQEARKRLITTPRDGGPEQVSFNYSGVPSFCSRRSRVIWTPC